MHNLPMYSTHYSCISEIVDKRRLKLQYCKSEIVGKRVWNCNAAIVYL